MFLIRVVVVDVDDNLIDRRYNMSVEPSLTPEHILYPSHAFVDGAARCGTTRHDTTRRGLRAWPRFTYHISVLYISITVCKSFVLHHPTFPT